MKYLLVFLLAFSISCASVNLIRPLKDRSLSIDVKSGGLVWRTCLKSKFMSSKCKLWHVDRYDLNDMAVRQKLHDMGFVMKVR